MLAPTLVVGFHNFSHAEIKIHAIKQCSVSVLNVAIARFIQNISQKMFLISDFLCSTAVLLEIIL